LLNPTSTLASPPRDVVNLESSLLPDHPDAEYLESDDDDASEASDTNSDSEDLTETQVVKEHKKAKLPELPPIWVDERNLEEPRKKGKGNLPQLLVREVLV
jgi:Trm5-related predicted tRNA methylase